MLFRILDPRYSLEERLAFFLGYLIGLTVGMTIHEFAHNYVAHLMGDPNPKQAGRLTLNPLVHIYLPGWLMFMVVGFGILGFAPIDWRRMPIDNRRWRWLAAVAAGPLSNLVFAIIVALIARILGGVLANSIWEDVLRLIVQLNVLLFVFNLLPLFPIDGWQIVWSLLPPDLAYQWDRHKMTTQYVFFGLILLSFINSPLIPDIFGILIGGPTAYITRFLLG